MKSSKILKRCSSLGIAAIFILSFAGCSSRDEFKADIENMTVNMDVEEIPNIDGWKVSIEGVKCDNSTSDEGVGEIIVQDGNGDEEVCTVTGKDKENVKVNINKDKKEIILTSDKKYLESNGELKININVPITFLQIVEGVYDLNIDMKDSKSFSCKLKCGVKGDMNIKNADKVDLDFIGAGDIDLEGNAKDINIECKGFGNIDAGKFEVRNAKVTLNGTGDCTVNAKTSLEGIINGVGSIKYKGNPKEVKKAVNGLGEISEM